MYEKYCANNSADKYSTNTYCAPTIGKTLFKVFTVLERNGGCIKSRETLFYDV